MTAESNETLVVAGVPEHFNLPWHLAQDAGKFSQAGIQLEYRDFPGGTGAMTAALASGEIEMALLLAEGAVADVVRRRQSVLVKVYVESPLIWGIHVAASSEIGQVEEIQNHRYAISRYGSGSHLMAIVDASERGWNTEELKFEIVRNLDGARTALAEETADIFLWEQFTTQPFVDNGEFRRVGVRETLWPAFVIAVDKQVLETKRNTIQKALEIVNEECSQLMQNPNASSLISNRYHLEVEQVDQWLSLTRWSTDFDCPEEAFTKILEYLNRLNIVDTTDVTIQDIWTKL